MEFFLPSIFAMMLAFFVSRHFFTRGTSLITLGILALLLLLFTVYNHYSFFATEYRIMTWADTAKQFAPTLLVSLVIVFMIGYLLFAAGIKPGGLSMPSSVLPPGSTATNALTRGINDGLVAAGAATNSNDDPPSEEEIQMMRNQGMNVSAFNRGS
jgi:hypothetical protein